VRFLYRAHQFFQALTAVPSLDDLEEVEEVLSPALLELFYRLQAGEQKHSIEIYRELKEQDETNIDLLVAALLHDVGKSCHPLCIWERVVIVLSKSFFPDIVKEWGQAEVSSWKRPFVVAEQHASWGAQLVKNAGGSAMTVALIRRHQDEKYRKESKNNDLLDAFLEERLLYRLQNIDNES